MIALLKSFGNSQFEQLEMKMQDDKKVFDERLAAMEKLFKAETKALCEAKDATIKSLEASLQSAEQNFESKNVALEEKLDASEAYGRKDSVIISGAVPPLTHGEATNQVVVDLLKTKFPTVSIGVKDINIFHRLKAKRSPTGTVKPPNIYVKLCRRSQKQELIQASKSQPRDASNKIFRNESLTAQRAEILKTLVKIKKSSAIVKGVTSMDGNIYVYTPTGQGNASTEARAKDLRHMVNTKRELQKFCNDYLRKPLEDFVNA